MRWKTSLLAAGALALLLSSASLGAVRTGAWVKTEKTLTQLLSEKFDIKSIFLVSPVPATIYILQKHSALYECRLPSDRRRAECWILAEE